MVRKLTRTTVYLYEDQVMFAKRSIDGMSGFIRNAIDNEMASYPAISDAKLAALQVLTTKLPDCTPEKLYDIAMKQGIITTIPQIKAYLESIKNQ